jgi:small GTP-binding protein
LEGEVRALSELNKSHQRQILDLEAALSREIEKNHSYPMRLEELQESLRQNSQNLERVRAQLHKVEEELKMEKQKNESLSQALSRSEALNASNTQEISNLKKSLERITKIESVGPKEEKSFLSSFFGKKSETPPEPPKKTLALNSDVSLKIVLVGNCGVGMSSFLHRFVNAAYREDILPLISAILWTKSILVENREIQLRIWELPGRERDRSLHSLYYRDAHGFMVLFSLGDRASFRDLSMWIQHISSNTSSKPLILIVGTQSDREDIEISESEISNYAADHCCEYVSTSAKTGEGVDRAFVMLCREITQRDRL